MALSKRTRVRIMINQARRRRWADRSVRDYERAMAKWHEKYVGEAERLGHYSEEAMTNEPVYPEKLGTVTDNNAEEAPINPNNCDTCDYKRNPDGGHCYMFRDAPIDVCMQHTGRNFSPVAPLEERDGKVVFSRALIQAALDGKLPF